MSIFNYPEVTSLIHEAMKHPQSEVDTKNVKFHLNTILVEKISALFAKVIHFFRSYSKSYSKDYEIAKMKVVKKLVDEINKNPADVDNKIKAVFFPIVNPPIASKKNIIKFCNSCEFAGISKLKKDDFLLDTKTSWILINKIIREKWLQAPEYFNKLGIKDEQIRYEFAKYLANMTPERTSEYIKNFEITKEQRFEVAKNAVQARASHLMPYIKCYKITNSLQLAELAKLSIDNIFNTFSNLNSGDLESFLSSFVVTFKGILPALNPKLSPLVDLKEKTVTWENPCLVSDSQLLLQAFINSCKLHSDQDGLITFFKLHPHFLTTLFNERDPNIYATLFSSLLNMKGVDKPIANTVEKQMGILPFITMDVEDKENLVQRLLQCDLHDTHLRSMVILFLKKIDRMSNLTAFGRKKILELVFEKPKDKSLIKNRCNLFKSVSNFEGDLSKELHNSDNKSLEMILIALIQKLMPALKLGTISLQNTFFKTRNAMAILIYATDLARLPPSIQKVALENLTLYMNSVFDGIFKQIRQDIEMNKHLKFLQENYSSTLSLYHQGSIKQINFADIPKQETLKKIIENSINHNRMKDAELAKINMDFIPKNEHNFDRVRKAPKNDVALNNYIAKFEEEIKALSKEKGKVHKKDQEKFQQLDAYVTYLKLQKSLLQLMNKNVTKATFNECYSAFKKTLVPNSDLWKDLKRMGTVFQSISGKVILTDTDDPYEILLCGTDVEASCQRIGGNPRFNRGLLGYLLNGQTRLLTFKENDNDIIKGRAIMRLLIDEDDKPVLLIEPIYPRHLDPTLEKLLIDFAKEKAKMLNVSLVGKTGNKSYAKQIKSLDGRALEYIDAIDDLRTEYSIKGLYEYI